MTTLGVILARAGSKGLPGKNTRLVASQPCVAWTLDHALASESLDEIIVSSDDADVLEIARERSVVTHARDPHLASDTATVDDAVRSAINDRNDADAIVILYGNVPVRPPDLIDRAVSVLHKTRCDSVQSYCPVGKHHPWWMTTLGSDGEAVQPWQGDTLNHSVYRRQELPPAFIPDGGVLAVTREALFCEIPGVDPGPHAFLGRDRRGVKTREGEVIDIDSEIDLLVADAILTRATTTARAA